MSAKLDPNNFVNKEAALKFKCSKCQGIVPAPYQDECGHLGCQNCLKSLINAGNLVCPVTGEPKSTQITLNTELQEQLNEQLIFCPNKDDCQKQVRIANLEVHLKNDCYGLIVKCDQIKAGTEQCGAEIKRKDLESHKLTCEWVPKDCEFCKLPQFKANDTIMEEHHNSDCQEIPIDCAKKCIVKHKRKHQELHDKFNCQKKIEDCYFRSAGCFFTGNWDEMGRHSSEAFIIHAQFLEQKLQHFEAYRKVVADLVKDIQADKAKYPELQKYVKEIDDTEDIDFKMFQGAFDKQYSSDQFEFQENSDDRIVSTRPGAKMQILYFNRRFHERHRLVINLEVFQPADPSEVIFKIGLVRKGVLLERDQKHWAAVSQSTGVPADKSTDNRRKVNLYREFQKDFKLFEGVAKGVQPKEKQIVLEAGQDYMLSYDPDNVKLIFENLNMDVDNPPYVEMDLPTEFWEYQPALILSHHVKVQLMDFNDWNQH